MMTNEEFSGMCLKFFETLDINKIAEGEFGLVFLSLCEAQLDNPPLQDAIINILESDIVTEYELERQRGMIYGESISTSPHTSQYDETLGKSPAWIWNLK
jgi:hypothetical protein|tara:strand:+ start:794 stop:1093 length:300 start_codon:yes stop_codon:yes gene_type:complete